MLKRNGALRSFKKTLRRLHRSKGYRAISFPYGKGAEDLLKVRLLGSSRIEGEEFVSLGDKVADNEYYVIMHAHGRNLIDGYHFASTLYTIVMGKTPSGTGSAFVYNMQSAPHLSPIYSDSYLTFKKNTRYTFASRNYPSAFASETATGLCFVYDDGSTSEIKLPNPEQVATVNGCCTSLPGKSVKYVATYATEAGTKRIYSKYVGIFEGAYESYDDCFEAYDGSVEYITLKEPLRSVGYVSDEVDLLSDTLTRRINEIRLDGASDVYYSEENDCYVFPLSIPALHSLEPLAVGARAVSCESLLGGECGCAFTEEGDAVLYRPARVCASVEELRAALDTSPIRLLYVRRKQSTEPVSISIIYRDGYNGIEMRSAQTPRRFFAEYY